MSYESTVRGRITIEPPLTFAEYSVSPFRAARRGPWRDVTLEYQYRGQPHDSQISPDGGLGFVAVAVVGHEASYSLFDMDVHLAELIQAFLGHAFNGSLVRLGREQGDVVRYKVWSGQVFEEKASLVWPDGSPVAREDYEL